MALNDEFRTYLPVILPSCIQVLSDAERSSDYTYVLDILHTIEVFGGKLIFLTVLVALFTISVATYTIYVEESQTSSCCRDAG